MTNYKAVTRNKKPLKKTILKNFLKTKKKDTITGIVRNIKRDDLWLKRDLIIECFKKNF